MKTLLSTLERLAEVIAQRKREMPEDSYVAKLFKKGRKKIAQKIGEEGVEVAIAAVRDKPEEIVEESADLLLHLLVLWQDAGIDPAQIAAELQKREGVSGLEEKRARGK